MQDESELLDLIALNGTAEIGPATFLRLLEHFGSTKKILEASNEELLKVESMRAQAAANIRKSREIFDPEKELKQCEKLGLRVLPCTSVEYPASLKKINDPPIVLYVKGEVRPADSLAIAVVGSRQASYYGKRQSESLSFALAQIGITVVSGLARGIDAFAHEGAMKAHGRTIAVVGSGLADPYPRENRALADRIAECGAVVSEFPLDFPVRAENFPRRNRIIAGLSLGVVVVEAALRSGSLITARWAAEQGKDVFAVPGNVDSPSSRGCHQLLKDGAKLVEDVGDILEELGPLVEAIVFRDESALKDSATGPAMKLALSENESKVYAALSTEPMNVEEIIDLSGLSVQAVSAALSLLVLKRFATRLPGQMYVKNSRKLGV